MPCAVWVLLPGTHMPCTVGLLPLHAPRTQLEELGSDVPTCSVPVHWCLGADLSGAA